MSKRKDPQPSDAHDKMEIMPLGAGNEVGRSCVHMTYKGRTVLFDCGIHPAYSGIAALPFFDEIDPSTIDVLLVTHFHLDHAASLPYFLKKTSFQGRVFMTHATRAVYHLLLRDFVKVSRVAVDDQLFDDKDIADTMDRIEVIDFGQEQEVNGIKFRCYTAGHVLGAAMFMVDIAGVRVLYTGDYSREEDRHLRAAEVPPFSPDLCIIESTYGVQLHEKREVRESRFTDIVSKAVLAGGRVLIPAFALGRAQELLLILDEYWQAHPELHKIPIYYASPLAKRCMAVYQTYINSMNDRIRKQFEQSNPFAFKHISDLRGMDQFQDTGPAVVMASPGGLQSGLSRQLFDAWCQDRRNACVIPGYVVEGTLAKTILGEPAEVTLGSGLVVPLRMRVHYVSFSAHADFAQTSAFLHELRPAHIILVHGEATAMARLKGKLGAQFQEAGIGAPILTPKNCQTVELLFKGEKVAKAVGRLAERRPEAGAPVSGLLVRKGFTYQLLAPEDLPVYTQLASGVVEQRQVVPYAGSFAVLQHRLEQMYEQVELLPPEQGPEGSAQSSLPTLKVHDWVTVSQESADHVMLQWRSDPVSDMVADSVIALVLQFSPGGTAPAGLPAGQARAAAPKELKQEGEGGDALALSEGAGGPDESLGKVEALLANMFGDVTVDVAKQELTVVVDEGTRAVVNHASRRVEGTDEALNERIRLALRRLRAAMYPLAPDRKSLPLS